MALTPERIKELQGYASGGQQSQPSVSSVPQKAPVDYGVLEHENDDWGITKLAKNVAQSGVNFGTRAVAEIAKVPMGLTSATYRLAGSFANNNLGSDSAVTKYLNEGAKNIDFYKNTMFESGNIGGTADTMSGKVGGVVGKVAPYFAGAGALSMARFGANIVADTLIGTGQTGNFTGGAKTGLVTAVTGGIAPVAKSVSSLFKGKGIQVAQELASTIKPTGFVSGVKQFGSTVAKNASVGYTGDVAQNIADGKENILAPGYGTLLAGTLGGAMGAKPFLKATLPKSENIMQRVGRISKLKQVEFEKTAGESVGSYLTKRKIFGNTENIVTKLYDRFSKSKDRADEALASLGGNYRNKVITTALDDLEAQANRISSPGATAPELSRIKELKGKHDGVGLTHQEINEAKRMYERNIKLDFIKDRNTEGVKRANLIDDNIRAFQFEEANKAGLKNLPEINRETRLARQLADDIGRENAGSAGNNAITLTDWMMLSGGNPAALAGFMAKKTFGSKTVQSKVAQLLRNKSQDIGEIEAQFGGKTGLPAKIDGVDYRTATEMPAPKSKSPLLKDEKRSPKVFNESIRPKPQLALPEGNESTLNSKTIPLPKSARKFNMGTDEISSLEKQRLQQLQKKGLEKSYTDIVPPKTSKSTPLKKNTTQSGMIKIGDNEKDRIAKALMDYDTTPVTVNGNIHMEHTTPDFRLGQLQDKIKNKSLTDLDYIEVRDLLENRGAIEKSSRQAGMISLAKNTPLHQEARKFKTKEEFVKELNTHTVIRHIQSGEPFTSKLYHGTPDARFAEEFNPNQKGYFKDAPDLVPDNTKWESIHGKTGGGFKTGKGVYDGLSFSDSKPVAESYANKIAFDNDNSVPMVLERYVSLKNPKVIDVAKGEWKNILENEIAKAKNDGHDGIIFKNIKDNYHPSTNQKESNNVIVFKSDSIKTKSQLEQIWKEANAKASTKQGMTPINPLTVGAGVTLAGATAVAIKNKEDKKRKLLKNK